MRNPISSGLDITKLLNHAGGVEPPKMIENKQERNFGVYLFKYE